MCISYFVRDLHKSYSLFVIQFHVLQSSPHRFLSTALYTKPISFAKHWFHWANKWLQFPPETFTFSIHWTTSVWCLSHALSLLISDASIIWGTYFEMTAVLELLSLLELLVLLLLFVRLMLSTMIDADIIGRDGSVQKGLLWLLDFFFLESYRCFYWILDCCCGLLLLLPLYFSDFDKFS